MNRAKNNSPPGYRAADKDKEKIVQDLENSREQSLAIEKDTAAATVAKGDEGKKLKKKESRTEETKENKGTKGTEEVKIMIEEGKNTEK